MNDELKDKKPFAFHSAFIAAAFLVSVMGRRKHVLSQMCGAEC
jgi:hypothetical protein